MSPAAIAVMTNPTIADAVLATIAPTRITAAIETINSLWARCPAYLTKAAPATFPPKNNTINTADRPAGCQCPVADEYPRIVVFPDMNATKLPCRTTNATASTNPAMARSHAPSNASDPPARPVSDCATRPSLSHGVLTENPGSRQLLVATAGDRGLTEGCLIQSSCSGRRPHRTFSRRYTRLRVQPHGGWCPRRSPCGRLPRPCRNRSPGTAR